ncbi:MAG: hypothetical protein ACTSQO_01210 [Candidatus Helarchaeota archaeon]
MFIYIYLFDALRTILSVSPSNKCPMASLYRLNGEQQSSFFPFPVQFYSILLSFLHHLFILI